MERKPFLVPFKAFHFDFMKLRKLDELVVLSMPGNYGERLAYERSGYSWTGIVGTELLGAGGVLPIWPGTACCWLVTTPLIEKYGKFLHRVVMEKLKEAIRDLNLHRIETTILTSHQVSQKWAARLGFEYEGLARKMDSNKNDYYRYAIISGD